MGKGIQILAILIMVHAAKATLVPTKFKKLGAGKTMIGEIGAELTTRSKLQCSDKCSSEVGCKAYRYKGKERMNCLLIHSNSSAADGEIFEGDDSHNLYEKESNEQITPSSCPAPFSTANGDIWVPPNGWDGPCPALYRSFDTSTSLDLIEVDQNMGPIPLVTGKVNLALSLDHAKSQWVDLGIHTDVCMTQPDTCGAAGGAISVWVNIIDCSHFCGIISSFNEKTEILIHYQNTDIGFYVVLSDRQFEAHYRQPATGWTHLVLNYIGPDAEPKMFINGELVDSDITKYLRSKAAGDGRIVAGRGYTYVSEQYASAQVDEMIIFNRALKPSEVETLFSDVV